MRIRTDDVFTTTVDGRSVLLDARTSQYLLTNSAATTLLELLRDGATSEHLATELAARFDLDPVKAEADTAAFLAQLRAHDLLLE